MNHKIFLQIVSDRVCIRKAPAKQLAVSHRGPEISILLQHFEECKTNLYVDLCANDFYSGFLHPLANFKPADYLSAVSLSTVDK